MISQERLKELLHYDPNTGIFVWRVRKARNTNIGDVAGWLKPGDKGGYIMICVDYKQYRAHHLAWLWMTGKWPIEQIDHKNAVRNDNRFSNLRDVSDEINRQNVRTARSHNALGVLGVFRKRGKFAAKIGCNRKQQYLGTFNTPELAHAAYLDAKRRLHPGCTI